MNKRTILFALSLFASALSCAQPLTLTEIYFIDDERSVEVKDGKIVDLYLYDIFMANYTKSIFVSIQCDTSFKSFSSDNVSLHFKSTCDTLKLRQTCSPQQKNGKVIYRLMTGVTNKTLPVKEQFYRRNVLKGWGLKSNDIRRKIGRSFAHNSLSDCACIRRTLQKSIEILYYDGNSFVPIEMRNVPVQMMIHTTREEKSQIKTMFCH